MGDHWSYLEEMKITQSEWTAAVNSTANKILNILRENGATYHEAKAALSKAGSILDQTVLKAKI